MVLKVHCFGLRATELVHTREKFTLAEHLLVLEIRSWSNYRQGDGDENEGISAAKNNDSRPHFEEDDEEVRFLLGTSDSDSDGCRHDSVKHAGAHATDCNLCFPYTLLLYRQLERRLTQ